MENKKIKLDELIEKLIKRNSQNAKDVIMKTIEVKNYVSYVMKEVTARQIIQTSHFIYPTDSDISEMTNEEIQELKGIPSINYSKQYLFTALMLVDLYTNIDVDFSKGVNEYDKLAEYGIMNYIINNIPDSEIQEFRMLIDYEYETYFQKYHSTQSYINRKFNETESMVMEMMNLITDNISKLATENNKKKVNEVINVVKETIVK